MARKSNGPTLSDSYLYPPARAASAALREFQRRKDSGFRLDWGIRYIDSYMIPLMAGDQVTVVGRPGQAKTSIMVAFSKRASSLARTALTAGTIEGDPIVVYATWETMVEEFVGLIQAGKSGHSLESIARGTANLAQVGDAVISTITDRMYVIGKSIEEANKGARQIPLTLLVVQELLDVLVQDGKSIMLVILDYLQRIPPPASRMDDRERVTWNAHFSKDMGMRFACPVMQAAQASRDVDDYTGLKFAKLNDAQWASSIEQDTDKWISVTRPCTYMPVGSTVGTPSGKVYVVDEALLAIKWGKQRWGPSGATHFMSFNPALLTIGSIGGSRTSEGEGEEHQSAIPF